MEYKLLGISGLILIILLLTWLKDGKHMNPPIERRAIIDTTTNSANPETYLGGTWERYDKSQQKLAAAPNNGTSVAGQPKRQQAVVIKRITTCSLIFQCIFGVEWLRKRDYANRIRKNRERSRQKVRAARQRIKQVE